MESLKKGHQFGFKSETVAGYYLIKLKIIDLPFKVLVHLEKNKRRGGGGWGWEGFYRASNIFMIKAQMPTTNNMPSVFTFYG